MDNTISALRVDLYECDERPSNILKPFEPENAVNCAWIPQTLGDQIWVLYEFASETERIAWEDSLPESVSRWLDRKLIGIAKPYGWKIRDFNGFEINT